jgi:CelD/BcsL family acetyltransferase involved in cellulose biosynthesis
MSIAVSPRALSCTLESLQTFTALEALQGEWWALWRRAHATPFQSPAWLLPWWNHIGRGELAGLAVRDGSGLIGLAPMYIWRDEEGTRHLFPLGIATTDHLDALSLPGREEVVALAITEHLERVADRWDVFEAPQLPMDALLLRCRWPTNWIRELRECEPHPVVALPARVPRSLARAIAYSARRAAVDGGFEFEMADENSLQARLDALASLHARRWAPRGMPGVLGEHGVLDWHREAAPQLLAEGLLRLIGVRFRGRIVAVALGLADAPTVLYRRWYFYIGGFDPACAFLSPGTLLIGHGIELATSEGARWFDLLRGTEEYKYRWGATDEPMFSVKVTRSARRV